MLRVKKNICLLRKAISEVRKLSPNIILTSIINSICNSMFPFISIYFISEILSNLINKSKNIILYILVYTIISGLIFFLKESLSNINRYEFDILYGNELNSVSECILNNNYQSLEDYEYREIITKHQESINHNGGPLTMLTAVISSSVSSLITILLSLVFVLPFFQTLLLNREYFGINSKLFVLLLCLLLLLCCLLTFIISLIVNKKKHSLQNEFYSLNKLINYYTNLLLNYKSGKEVRIFEEQNIIKKQVSNILKNKAIPTNKKVQVCEFILESTTGIVGCLLGSIIYFLIGVNGLLGLISLATIVRFIGSFIQLAKSMSNIGNVLGSFGNIIPSLNYYFDVFNKKKFNDNKGSTECDSSKIEISFEHVNFKYENSNILALEDVSFEIFNGEKVAIVGENGSGKTTLIKLLCRLYRPKSGRIKVNHIDINEYNENFEKLFSVVFQDYNIFSLPIGQTIASGTVYEIDKIKKSLDKINMSSFVEQLPNKYNTYINKDCDKDGIEISGGESQKIAIARALYRNAPIMILDEPTAALDPYAEYDLYKKFNDITDNKTVIYISHRLSSCRFCSKIIVLDKGHVVQIGQHNELLKNKKGKYFELWDSQAKNYIY